MSRRLKVLLAVGVVLVVVVGGGLWWFFKDDAPDEVSLDDAVAQVEDASDAPDTTDTTADEASAIEGTWTIDTQTGDFDLESATGTFAGYRVEEELATIGSNTAVGRTGDVTGSFTIEGTTVTDADFEVDLTGLTSDEGLRDGRAQDALETSQFPTATFTLTEPIELGDGATSDQGVAVDATGDLTIHGVTNSVELPLEARLVDDTVVLVGSLDFALSDFDIDVPTTPIALSISDQGTFELQFLLTR